MNVITQMSEAAAQIYPEQSLAVLCQRGWRTEEQKRALYKIMWSSSFYLTPVWIAFYFPISESSLHYIKRNHYYGRKTKVS